MKQKELLSVFLIALFGLIPQYPYSQCFTDTFMDKCASSLGAFTFMKSFNIELGKATGQVKSEQSYVLSKGSKYLIIICDQNINGNKMIVSLFDRNHKLIASSFNKKSKKHYHTLSYPCTATGVYYIESSFETDKGGCGVNIIGFNKS